MIKIGSTEIGTNVFLAPLSGCSDLAFRLIAREEGAGFCFFEMVDSNSVSHHRRKTESILKLHKDDCPIAAQILGADPETMLRAAREVLKLTDTSFLDINAACPVRKVIKKKAGAYLLRDGAVLYKIIRKLAGSLSVPVTVKIRLSHYEKTDVEAIVKVAKKCEETGASAIFVHGRTRPQAYSGDIDYTSIRAIKDALKIPVFGSGNIFTPQLAKKMFDETNCDGILVARGSLGNPWIFNHVEGYLKNGAYSPAVETATKKIVLKRHLSYIDRYSEASPLGKIGVMRKVMMWYLKGFPEAKRIRSQIAVVKEYGKMVELIESCKL